MGWWIIANSDSSAASAKRLLEEMRSHAERIFLINNRGSETVWAEMLTEAESIKERPSILVTVNDEQFVKSHSLILNYCCTNGIGVFLESRIAILKTKELSDMFDHFTKVGYPAWTIALSWWMKINDISADYKYLSQIQQMTRFNAFMKGARARSRMFSRNVVKTRRSAFGDKPEERIVIDRILALHHQKKNLTEIALTINSEGFRTLTGKSFRPQTIKNCIERERILQRERKKSK